MSATRILIADDHPVFRSGLRAIVEGEPDLAVVGEAATADEAIELAERLRPDIVVMDLHMPGVGGIEATRRITERGIARVLVVSMLEHEPTVLSAVRAGASGYVLKGASGAQTLRALRAVANGEVIFGPALAPTIVGQVTRRSAPAPFGFSERELEIVELVAQGLTNDAIADRVYLSPKTVRNYVSAIFTKLEVSSRAEAVARARSAGFGEGRAGDR